MEKRKENDMKTLMKFVKSLRFRIMFILVLIGIIPSIIVEKGIVNSYEERAATLRTYNVRSQCEICLLYTSPSPRD